MLKITQIKVQKYPLALQKHLSNPDLQTTTKIPTMNNTKQAQNFQNLNGRLKRIKECLESGGQLLKKYMVE